MRPFLFALACIGVALLAVIIYGAIVILVTYPGY